MTYNKKGAMFGLDARIALAIFGALSVISGAALYSAIKESKVVAMITELDNLGKATESFYIDTGSYPVANATDIFLNAQQLITDPGLTNWQGPYTSFVAGTALMLDHTTYDDIALIGMNDSASAPALTGETGKCINGTSTVCDVYACIIGISDDMKTSIDIKVDGTESATAGKFRYTAGVTQPGCMKVMNYDASFAGT